MKKLFTFILAILLPTASAFAINGNGTINDPYTIGNVDELYEFAAIVNGTHDSIEKNIYAYGVLTDNITLNENLIDEAGNLSNPEPRIWTQLDQYHGVLDGQFHVIRGLYAVTPEGSSQSLRTGFIRKFNNGTVKNLGFEDAFIKSVNGCVGGICGDLWSGTILNCYFIGAIESKNTRIGGISSYCNKSGTISNCYTICKLTAQKDMNGICALNEGGTIKNCYTMSIDEPSDSEIRQQFENGEIAFSLQNGQIENVWGQSLDGDKHPVLAGEAVFRSPDGSHYTNTKEECAEHSFDNCICIFCGIRDSSCPCDHKIQNCQCILCGETVHDFDNCYCKVCKTKEEGCTNHIHELDKKCQCIWCGEIIHDFDNCYCKVCKTKEEGCTNHIHELDKKCQCIWCGEIIHDFDNCYCKVCKTKEEEGCTNHIHKLDRYCQCILCGETVHDFDNCYCKACKTKEKGCTNHTHELDRHCQCVWCKEFVHDFDNCYCKVCNAKEKDCTNHIHDFDNCYCKVCKAKEEGCDHIHEYNDYLCICGETDTTYYEIYTVDDLFEFAELVNDGRSKLNAKLMNDIVINDNMALPNSYEELSDGNFQIDSTLIEWTQIENYNGVLDGQGHVIKGLYVGPQIKQPTTAFKYLGSATIKNIGFENILLYGEQTGLSLWAERSIFENCHITGFIASTFKGAAGFASYTAYDCTFENCYNLAYIHGPYMLVSGIVNGWESENIRLNKCWNGGEINTASENTFISGIFSSCGNNVIATNCYNIGTVRGLNEGCHVGGILSISATPSFTDNCYNYGTLLSSHTCDPIVATFDRKNPIVNITPSEFESTSSLSKGIYYHNCYYLDSSIDETTKEMMVTNYPDDIDLHAMSAEQFANGEVCYRLNEGVTDGTQPYYQNLGEVSLRSSSITIDPYPVVDKSHSTVYRGEEKYLNHLETRLDDDRQEQLAVPIIFSEERTIYVGNVNGRVLLSDMHGKVIFSKKVQNIGNSAYEKISIPNTGSYILVINGTPYKVIVK